MPLSELPWLGHQGLECLIALDGVICRHKNIIGANSTDEKAPPPGSRTLVQRNSEAEDEDGKSANEIERSSTWTKVQQTRQTYVTVSHFNDETESKVKRTIAQQSTEDLSKGKEYRLLVFSVEAYTEAKHKPWSNITDWTDDMGSIIQAMLENKTEKDVILVHDGRSRTARREIEALFMKHAKHWNDVWITFTSSEGKSRNVFMAANNRESMFA